MAAISVSQIVKEALTEIKNRHLMLTPENYTDIFNEISKKYGFVTEESRKIEKYISRLSLEYRNQASNLNIKTIDEFVAFMTARLVRNSSQQNTQTSAIDENIFKSLNSFARRVLQAITVLHNKNAKILAEDGMKLLAQKYDDKDLDAMREKWFKFIDSYNPEFLDFLKYYGVRSFDDLPMMSKELENFLTLKQDRSGIALIADLIMFALEPSITNELTSELNELKNEITQNPTLLETQELRDKIKGFVERRIEEDKAEIKQQIGSLNDVLESIGDKISEIVISSNLSSQKMQNIRQNIKDISLNTNTIGQVKNMILEVANALEIESQEFGIEMSNNQATISDLQNRVSSLEKELEAAKLESQEDYLTKVATKRALMKELDKIESSYKRYGHDYSLCFVDIDFFKNINDNYGHDAGDIILSTVAKILKKNLRDIDFVGRYGGEEFVILLPSASLKDAVKCADKLRVMIDGFKFIYKTDRIKVSISSGVATRGANASSALTLEAADKMLYAAKQGGRNQVMPKIIDEI
ncbi:diguanylate cyclase [Campylobacter sp. faydin G-140]|uniref:GGDEF domain-containing protein n=1 Tax=Campylobacter anatolicus TaxID=2829105 RepID=UPI001B9B38F4|nr:GGDEF domain-containing protein [Campylobacter anatolicus]MBR8462129.1 diguanylate cyclase [Campylobacter anatolicus]MBR8464785.1 diguanylate cyclase [Campylobacter anatolicus]